MSSFAHRRVIKGYQYLFMVIFNPGKGSMALMYRLKVLVTASLSQGASHSRARYALPWSANFAESPALNAVAVRR